MNLKNKFVSIWIGAFFLLGLSSVKAESSLGTLLDGLSHITYDSNLPFTIGDTLHANDLSNPRQRCMEFDSEALIRDTTGSVTSKLSMRMVRSFSDLENQFKFSFSAHAAAKANVLKIVSGESSFTGSGKFEHFLKNHSDTMMLILEIDADHGRNLISDYSYKDEYQALLDNDNTSEFLDKCGTHFVRGWKLRSMVRVIFYMSNLNSAAKNVIETKFKAKSKAGASIEGITAEAETQFSTDMSNILKTASKLGKIEIEVSTIGGQGVEMLSQLVEGLNVESSEDIGRLVGAIKEAGKTFTPAPAELLVIPFVGIKDMAEISFDAGRYEKMGDIFKALVRVDNLLAKYSSYQLQNFSLWNRYFRVRTEKLRDLRNTLARSYAACRKSGNCEINIPEKIDGVVLENILYDITISAACTHAYTSDEKINDVTAEQRTFLSSVILRLRSNMRFGPEIDTRGIRLFRITPELVKEELVFNHDRQFRSRRKTDTEDTIFVTLHREKAARDKAFVEDELDRNYLQSVRRHAARSIYIVEFPFTNGTVVEETLGYPDMKMCALEKAS